MFYCSNFACSVHVASCSHCSADVFSRCDLYSCHSCSDHSGSFFEWMFARSSSLAMSNNAVSVSVGAHIQFKLGHIAKRVVESLSPNLSFVLPDNWQPLFDVVVEARTFDQWYILYYCINASAVVFARMIPTCVHLYVDGSFFRKDNKAGWAFVVVKEVIGGKCGLEGYAA